MANHCTEPWGSTRRLLLLLELLEPPGIPTADFCLSPPLIFPSLFSLPSPLLSLSLHPPPAALPHSASTRGKQGFVWSMLAALSFFDNIAANRRGLILYPVFLFYLVIAWLIVNDA